MGTVRLRHATLALAYTPDGKTFATAGNDNLIRLWNVADGKEIRQFKGHTSAARSLAFSADGKRLFSCANDGTVREWDTAEAKELRSLPGIAPGTGLTSLILHPKESRLMALDSAGVIREWDLVKGMQTRTTDKIEALQVKLSPDGEHYATLGKDNTVQLFDLLGKETQRFPAARDKLARLVFSPDGSVLAAAHAKPASVTLWDVKKNEEIRTLSGLPATPIMFAVSPDNKQIVVQGDSRVVTVTIATGAQVYKFDIPNVGYFAPPIFAPDGKMLAACPLPGIRLWNLESGKPQHDFPAHETDVLAVRFSPDGKRLTSTGRGATNYWWNAATGTSLQSWHSKEGVTFPAPISPDGNSFFAPTFAGIERVTFAADQPMAKVVARSLDGFIHCSAVTADGKMMAARGRGFSIHFLNPDGESVADSA